MRRVDRVRLEKRQRTLVTVGLAFALGALTAGALIWRVDQRAAASVVDLAQHAKAPATERQSPTADSPPLLAAATTGREAAAATPERLTPKQLLMPVEGISRDQLHDTFDEGRAAGLRRHEALDIMAPRGTPVRAVEDGHVAKLFTSAAGGLTIYQFDPSQTLAYYYAHLDRYASGLTEGQQLHRGDLLGYVGSTGNASDDAPHLHFAIFRLGPERQWWKGDPINPYPILR